MENGHENDISDEILKQCLSEDYENNIQANLSNSDYDTDELLEPNLDGDDDLNEEIEYSEKDMPRLFCKILKNFNTKNKKVKIAFSGTRF